MEKTTKNTSHSDNKYFTLKMNRSSFYSKPTKQTEKETLGSLMFKFKSLDYIFFCILQDRPNFTYTMQTFFANITIHNQYYPNTATTIWNYAVPER